MPNPANVRRTVAACWPLLTMTARKLLLVEELPDHGRELDAFGTRAGDHDDNAGLAFWRSARYSSASVQARQQGNIVTMKNFPLHYRGHVTSAGALAGGEIRDGPLPRASPLGCFDPVHSRYFVRTARNVTNLLASVRIM